MGHHLSRLGGLGIREASCKPGDSSEHDTQIKVRFVFLVNLDDETNEAQGRTEPQKKGEETNHLLEEDKSNLYLGIVLAAVTWLTGCFSYAQTSKSAEMMAHSENFIPPVATVVRDGRAQQIDAKTIVPGDIVEVKG
jgi:hypothetical protein